MLGIFFTTSLFILALLLLGRLLGRKWREGEPPLIKGWIPFLGKTFEFQKNSHKFLVQQQEKYGDVFTVLIAGKYMTFVMNPLLYPAVVKHGKQLDFHDFSDRAASVTFGYPAVRSGRFPGMSDQIQRSFRLLQGVSLDTLSRGMMGNLQLVLWQALLCREGSCAKDDWRVEELYEFCSCVMFEASFLTMFGRPAHTDRHDNMNSLRQNFDKFDAMFPLLIAQVPISLLGKTKAIREELTRCFLPHKMAQWCDPSEFVQNRMKLFEQYDSLKDLDKAAHHFTILWASVGNTIPAAFWCLYHLLTHPEALEAVRDEIISVIGQEEAESVCTRDIMLSQEQLDRMIYLESAVNESLRLSSASMNIRVVQEDFSLRLDTHHSIRLRKHDIIALHPQSMHLDPDIFHQPQAYQFDRFVEDGKEKTDFYKHGQRLKYYLMPFGSGSTQCPGRFLALNELKQFLCVTLLLFQLELPAGQRPAMLDSSRAGIGILLPTNRVTLRYRAQTHQHRRHEREE